MCLITSNLKMEVYTCSTVACRKLMFVDLVPCPDLYVCEIQQKMISAVIKDCRL